MIVVAGLLATLALLIAPPHAHGNFVYWANSGQTTIGRAKLNGSAVNNAFISGLTDVHGVAIDSRFIYWTQGSGATSSIGRANLNGSGANPSFIPHSAGIDFRAPSPDPLDFAPQPAIAVNTNGVYWSNTETHTIGRANIDGSAPNSKVFNVTGPQVFIVCGIAVTDDFVYWVATRMGSSIERVDANGSPPSVFSAFRIDGVDPSTSCGLAVDSSFLYWGGRDGSIGRAPVGGGTASNSFIPSATSPSNTPCGVAVNSQYVFWGNSGPTSSIGRANLSGKSSNPSLIPGATDPCLPAAAPSNKITVNSVTRKKKGRAVINAKAPGPGQVGLQNSPPATSATASKVKVQSLTLGTKGSFKLPVKPKGKTAKRLKRKGKAKATVWITFLPAGVAGVQSSKKLTIHLVKNHKKKK